MGCSHSKRNAAENPQSTAARETQTVSRPSQDGSSPRAQDESKSQGRKPSAANDSGSVLPTDANTDATISSTTMKNGNAIGEHSKHIGSGPPSSAGADWMTPLLSPRESQRNTGVLETNDSDAESVTDNVQQ
uniref:Uncharacterized protein n=1 Tax=Pseudictyota dubia TaxID=2749911 RepID=A0A7R9VZI0_9STRA|mmetsp:Transcript_26224/g.48807  ORF Transcript_26224/g.48807 Transcript_26224/m.48807 type:complete len:132 (+) Transcript_26224:71-466(+)